MLTRTTRVYTLTTGVAAVLCVAAALAAVPGRAPAAGSRYAKLLADPAGRAKLQALAAMEEARRLDGIDRFVADRDPLVRLRCAEVLGRTGTAGAVPPLAVLARDGDAAVSDAAIFSLGLTMEEEAVETLAPLVSGGTRRERRAAIEALGITKRRSASPLIAPYLRNFYPDIRAAAATALAVLGDSSAAGECVNSLFDPDPRVVARVVYALGRLGHEGSADRIATLLGSGDAEVRARAAEALGRLRAKEAAKAIARLLDDPDRMCAVKAAEALGRIASDESAVLLEPLLGSGDPWMRSLALQGIAASQRKKSCDAVLPLLDDPSVMVRRAAIEAAARTNGGTAAPRLRAIAEKGTPYDRMAALEWLGAIGRKEDIETIASVLLSSADHLAREGAAAGLGRVSDRGLLFESPAGGGPDAFGVLLRTAGDGDWVVGTMAIDALGAEASRAVDTLAAVFRRFPGRADADRRLAVIAALERAAGSMEEPSRVLALAVLGEAVSDGDPRVAAAAVSAAAAYGATLAAAESPPPWNRGEYPWGSPALPLGERRIRITTAKGPIEIVLYGDEAPNAVRSILLLAEEGFYNGLKFHRVVPGFVAQGGCPRGDGWGDAGWYLRSQFNSHRYERGVIGLAHSGKDTPGSQFFIAHTAQPHLDGRYTVIGRVLQRMDIVDRLEIGDTFGITILE